MTPHSIAPCRGHGNPKESSASRRPLAVAVLLGAIVLLRLVCLLREPAFQDESSTASMAALPAGRIVSQFHLDGREFGQMPLTFLLARAGVVLGGPSLLALRAPFFLAGILGVVFVLAWSWRSEGPTAGILAMLLVAVSPAHVNQSHVARFYPVMFLAAAVSLAAELEVLARPTRRGAMVWALAALAGLYDHYGFWLFFGTGMVLAGAVVVRPSLAGAPGSSAWQHRRRLGAALLLVLVVTGVGYLPWAPRAAQFATSGPERMGAHFTRKKGAAEVALLAARRPGRVSIKPAIHASEYHLHDLSSPPRVGWVVLKYFSGGPANGLVALALLALGMAFPPRRLPSVRVVQLVFWLTPLAVLALVVGRTSATFHPRYLTSLLPPFILGLAAGVDACGRLAAGVASRRGSSQDVAGRLRVAVATLLALVVLAGQGSAVGTRLAAPGSEELRARIEWSLGARGGEGTFPTLTSAGR